MIKIKPVSSIEEKEKRKQEIINRLQRIAKLRQPNTLAGVYKRVFAVMSLAKEYRSIDIQPTQRFAKGGVIGVTGLTTINEDCKEIILSKKPDTPTKKFNL